MKIGRNEPCPCGSGRKHKKCCLDRGRQMTPEDSLQADGDPLHELIYSLPALEVAWPAVADLVDTTELEEGPQIERDGAGHAVSVTFTWVPEDAPSNNVDVGMVRIEPDYLSAHTSTARALDRLRRALEKRLPPEARLIRQKSLPGEASPDPSDVSFTEAIDAFIAEHHLDLPDRRIPALDDRTPRQACADPEGRERVAALLSAYEAAATPRQLTRLRPILAHLRDELGLPADDDPT